MSKMQKSKVLVMLCVDTDRNQGDAIRATDLISEFNREFSLAVVGMGARAVDTYDGGYWRIPAVKRGLSAVWNALGAVYGLICAFRFKPALIYADMVAGSVAPALVSALSRKSLILEVHGPAGAQDVALYRSGGRLKASLAMWAERFTVSKARRILGAKGWLDLVRHTHRLPEERCHTLPLGTRAHWQPIPLAQARIDLAIPTHRPTAVFIGNVGPWQGLDILVEAAPRVVAAHPEALFVIVGDGATRPSLMAKVEDSGLSRSFRFTGSIKPEKVAPYIAAADVALSLFPQRRGLNAGVSSIKTLQYLSMGCPVIATQQEELAVAIEAAGAGYRIPPSDADALAQALIRAFSTRDHAAVARENALHFARTLPTWAETVEVLCTNLKEVIHER